MKAELDRGSGTAVLLLDLGEAVWVRKGCLVGCDPSLQPVGQPGLLGRAFRKLTQPKSGEWLQVEGRGGRGRLFAAGLDQGEAVWIESGEGCLCRRESVLAWTGSHVEDPAVGVKLAGIPSLVRLAGSGSALISLPGGKVELALAHGQTLMVDPARVSAWDCTLGGRPNELGLIEAGGPGRLYLRGAIPEARLAQILPGRRPK